MIYDNHQFLTAGKLRGNDSAWTDIMNLIFSPNAWHNLVRCSQRCHWRFISSQRASQSRQKILLLSCIVWSVIVWNCILPHSLQFLLHQLYSKMVRKTKWESEKQCCTCSFQKILWHNVRVQLVLIKLRQFWDEKYFLLPLVPIKISLLTWLWKCYLSHIDSGMLCFIFYHWHRIWWVGFCQNIRIEIIQLRYVRPHSKGPAVPAHVSTEEAVSRWEKGFGKSCDSQQLLECILTFFPPKALKNNRTFHWIKKYFSIFLWYNFTECTGKWKQNKYQESTTQELPVHFFNVFFINCNFVRCKSSIHRVAVCVNACWLAAAHPYGSSLAENDL